MIFWGEAPDGVVFPGCSVKHVSHFLPCLDWLKVYHTICDHFKGLSLLRATVEMVLLGHLLERAHNLTVTMHSQETQTTLECLGFFFC